MHTGDTWLEEDDKGAASKRLILHGFFGSNFKADFPEWGKLGDEQKKEKLRKMSTGDAEKYAYHDTLEMQKDQVMLMPYPRPENKYYFIYEVPHESVEPIYYWLLGHMTYDWGYPVVHKISDIFTAAEHSSFYGASAQRLGLAQDKVAQYLATIGKMIKDMFQLVRELRWIDERKKYYEDTEAGKEGAEVALKEGKLLVLVPREMPFTAIQLENMLKLARLGAAVMPPQPAFYNRPKKLDDAVDFVVGKIMDRIGVRHKLYKRWNG